MAKAEANGVETRQKRRKSELVWRGQIRDFLKQHGESSLNAISDGVGVSYTVCAKVLRHSLWSGFFVQDRPGYYYLPGYKSYPTERIQALIPIEFVQQYLNEGWKVTPGPELKPKRTIRGKGKEEKIEIVSVILEYKPVIPIMFSGLKDDETYVADWRELSKNW